MKTVVENKEQNMYKFSDVNDGFYEPSLETNKFYGFFGLYYNFFFFNIWPHAGKC